jgi:hypothetical protein
LLGEPLEGKLHEWFLWGGTGDGPSRKVRHRASSLPDIVHCREADDGFGLENIFDLYTARLETFRQIPPPADWNGAFVLETK